MRPAGLCFYDHANFNGVMGKFRARELGFDACMFMLHKTFGAPKGGGGPAVGAYGCSAALAPFLPTPFVVKTGEAYALDVPAVHPCGSGASSNRAVRVHPRGRGAADDLRGRRRGLLGRAGRS